MPKFSVIIASLLRDSLADTIYSLYTQTFKDFEIIVRYDPDVSEYESRNRAVKQAKGEWLVFIDDDAYATPTWLETISRINGKYCGDGTVIVQNTKVDLPYLGIGTNLFIRRDIFDALNGFETWGSTRGWRSDTDLIWRCMDKFGEDKYIHLSDAVVIHPKHMQSEIDWDIEAQFFLRHKEKYIKYLSSFSRDKYVIQTLTV